MLFMSIVSRTVSVKHLEPSSVQTKGILQAMNLIPYPVYATNLETYNIPEPHGYVFQMQYVSTPK